LVQRSRTMQPMMPVMQPSYYPQMNHSNTMMMQQQPFGNANPYSMPASNNTVPINNVPLNNTANTNTNSNNNNTNTKEPAKPTMRKKIE